MRDGSNPALLPGLLVLLAVSVATVVFIGRSRLSPPASSQSQANDDGVLKDTDNSSSSSDSNSSLIDNEDKERSALAIQCQPVGQKGAAVASDVSESHLHPSGDDVSREEAAATTTARSAAVHEEEKEEAAEDIKLHELLTASPPCWQNPLVLGFNKLKGRVTLGSFSTVGQAR